MGGISIWQLLIVFGIVILVFGTKKLRNMGGDVGSAIRNFKQAVDGDSEKTTDDSEDEPQGDRTLKQQESEETPEAEKRRERDHEHS